MCSIAACQHLAVEQQGVTRFPTCHLFLGQRIEVYLFALDIVGRPLHIWPQIERGWGQIDRAAAVHHKMRMSGRSAVGNHGHRFAGGVGRVHLDFDIQYRGEPTQTLGPDAQCVDFFEQFKTQCFGFRERSAGR